jgi:HlyD family secretion protein
MKRIVRIALVVLVVAGLLYWAFRPAPVAADFATVERGTLQVIVEEEGRTRLHDRYVVSAPLPGRMRRIELEPGDPVVARKTVIAEFLPTPPMLLDVRSRGEIEARVQAAQAAVDVARAERDRIRAELPYAQTELKRLRELAREKVIAERELEGAERAVTTLERSLKSAESSVRAAEYQVQVARASLVQSRGTAAAPIPLYSPAHGVVLRVLQESETVVPTGQPLVEVGDLANLEIVSDLLSSAAVKVSPGQRVSIEQWGGNHPLEGRVRLIEPSGFTKISALGVEEQRVNVIVDFADPPGSRPPIGDGYRVEVRIIVWEKADVLKIPTSSLFRSGEQWAVYKVDGDVARRQIVDIGQQSGLDAEVIKGLAAGDRIVVYPSDALEDGARVTGR